MLRFLYYIIFLIPLFFVFTHTKGQDPPADTILFPDDEIIQSEDKHGEPLDSIDINKQEEIEKSTLEKEKKTDDFFENMDEQADKKRWMRELYDIIVIPPSRHTKSDSVITHLSIGKFLKYEGLIIKEIRLIKLDPFNVSIRDTASKGGNFWTRTGNDLHVKTQDRIIQKQLFIEKGQKISAQMLADNERLLRELPYIEDARIVVQLIDDDPGSAEIIIITKDVWSLGFFVDLKKIHAGKLEVYDKNFFGSGLEIHNAIHWNPLRPEKWGYEANYRNPNILGTFISSRLFYINVFDTKSYGYSLERKFYTEDIKYAGGSNGYFLNTLHNIWVPDSGYREEQIKTKYLDIWAGRSFQIKEESLKHPGSLNFNLASRIIKENYLERPQTNRNLYYRYHDKFLWLNTLAVSHQSYFKSNLIYSFGRTEDIPTGFLTEFTFGPEFSEFSTRFYTSLSLSKGNYVNKLGYLYAKMALGGFHTKNGSYEQSLLNFRVSWFTKLYIFGNYKFRQFVKVNYLKGFDRFIDEKIYINNSRGIRGFSDRNIFGDKKLVVSLETDAFLPFNLVGFQFVGFGFTDIAFLGDNNGGLLTNDIFTGFGLGVRIRNERLAFPTFQIRFALYPKLPDISPSDFIQFLGEERLRPENFDVNAPSLLDFR